MLVSISEQRRKKGMKVPAPLGQDVFITRRPRNVTLPLQQARLVQRLKPECQHVGRDVQAGFEFFQAS